MFRLEAFTCEIKARFCPRSGLRSIVFPFLIAAMLVTLPSCNDETSHNSTPELNPGNVREHDSRIVTIRPGLLSADEALALAEKIRAKHALHDLGQILRFVHFYKLGKREPALVALELSNEGLAKSIVASARQRRALEDQNTEIDLAEGLDLRKEVEGESDCQREVHSGHFKPLGNGEEFCFLWDSGILDLLPMPGKLMTLSERVLARQALRRLPRERLRAIPRAAAVMARYEVKRVALRGQTTALLRREDELIKQLLDLEWNVTLDLSSEQ
jgi:hypothetical protein